MANTGTLRDGWKNWAAGKASNVSNSPIVQVHVCVSLHTRKGKFCQRPVTVPPLH